jgi:hypothetical protein
MASKIGYVVTSLEKYYNSTFPVLQNGLLNAGIPKKDIYWIVGGCKKERELKNKIEVVHNSFDFTGFIGILEHDISHYSHIVYLLDTTGAGPNFKSLVENFDEDLPHTSFCGFMTMGVFHYEKAVLANKDFILSKRCMTKTQACENEVYWFKKYDRVKFDPCKHTTDNAYIKKGHHDVYKTGNPRRVFYFPYLDFYKFTRLTSSDTQDLSLI